MARAAVIGAGIAGLTAAFRLRQLGIEPVVYEARERVGGFIRSERIDGFLIEHGPNSIQSSGDALEALIEELGLGDERVSASEAARVRYVVRDGIPTAAPASPAQLLTTDLFRTASKLRVLREPFVSPAKGDVEESVADFVRRRLGPEFVDYGVDPFVAGVYAGDAGRLSVRHAFPGFYEMVQASGSILKGQFERRRGAAASAETHRMFSFRAGLGRLPEAVEAALDGCIHLDSAVGRIDLDGKRWQISSERRDPDPVDAVIYAAPLHALDRIDRPSGPDVSPLSSVLYAPLSVVAIGYRREHVDHPLDGFGLLVPSVESDLRILGTLFTSSIFPARAPDGHVLLTSFAGGTRDPDLATATDAEIFDVVRRDLRQLLGISGDPVLRRRIVWERSIPQYNIGYETALEAMNRLEEAWPGWFMAGNYRRGVSVADTAASGDEAARRCATYLEA